MKQWWELCNKGCGASIQGALLEALIGAKVSIIGSLLSVALWLRAMCCLDGWLND